MDSQMNFTIRLGSQDLTFSPTEFDIAVDDLIKKDEYLTSGQCDDDSTLLAGPSIGTSGYQAAYQPSLDAPGQVVPYTPSVSPPEESRLYPPSVGAKQPALYELAVEAPLSRPGPPDQTPWPGQFNFTVELCASKTNNKCLYSKQLNKIYVDMGVDIPFQFGWEPAREDMFVRACAVFVDREHAEKRVHCCLQHRPPNLPEREALNVLHSSRAAGTRGVAYAGAGPDHWYSLRVAFGADAQRTHAYRFICKNSCSSGINRRAIGIVFTLEDADGTVYGRQVVNARVCSCPPRDRRKDEDEKLAGAGKRRLPPAAAARGKKVKLEQPDLPALEPAADGADDVLLQLPPIQVVGARTLVAGLETMLHVSSARAAPPARLLALRRAIDHYRRVYRVA